MVATPEVESIRAQIPATGSLAYLNSGWQGPNPRSVIDAVRETFAAEAQGPTAPSVIEMRLAVIWGVRRALAELVNASAEEISLQQNATEGINIVLGGLGLAPADEVLTCDQEHSSAIVPCYHARERTGANVKIVRLSAADAESDIIDRLGEALTPATKLIVLSHVTFCSGQLLPIAEVCRLAHERDAYVLLDAAQSAGQLPLDVRSVGCDFCVIPGHKWLLGPAGTAALYVRHDLIERLEPSKVAHRGASSYDHDGAFVPRRDAIDKFELTTVSAPLLAGLLAAVRFVRGIGLETVQERALRLARRATARLGRIPGVRLVSAPDEALVSSGLVSFSLAGVPAEIATAWLWQKGRIVARTVPSVPCTRLSLHVFNTEEEVDAALAILEGLARSGPPPEELPSVRLEQQALEEL